MEAIIDIILLAFLLLVAIAAIHLRDLFAVVMLFSIYSLLTAALFMDLDAVDVAFTEAAVGAGVSTILMLSTLRLVGRQEAEHKRTWLPVVIVAITGAALLYGVSDAPLIGAPDAPAHQHVAPRYIQQGPIETGVPNMVTAVLASYRGFDTLGETLVIFTAGVAVLVLLGMGLGATHQTPRADGDELAKQHVVKILIPFILIFAVYVQFHGDFGAGGGFQAGVIFAAGFVLYHLVFGAEPALRLLPAKLLPRLAALGVLLYGGVGLYSIIKGEAFLNYNALSHDPIHGQHLGIFLIELGVGITVFSVVMTIYYAFSGRKAA